MGCGSCTACCASFAVKLLDKPANMPCIHCDAGCLIHDTKPAECSDFDCSYIQSGVDNENMRPDNCGIIFEKLSDSLFFGTVISDVSKSGHGQLQDFLNQGLSVVLSKENSQKFFINDNHIESEVRKEFNEIANANI